MPITSVASDPDTLTLTVVGEYDVPLERLWQAFVDPRQLERFWGPVEWPATFTRHDMAIGGQSRYYMTGPDGTRAHGWFRFLVIEPGRRIEVEDGFALDDGSPNPAMPTMRMSFAFEETPTGSRFTGVTRFESVEAMEQVLEMGMEEGMRSAMGQLDGVLADLAAFAADRRTEAQLLGETKARVSRIIRGTPEAVWRAHHDPALLKRWLLGPDGWTMPVCEVGEGVGESYRYGWEAEDGSGRFGFEGEILESEPPSREVTTQQMIGADGPTTLNELTLVPVPSGTLLTLVITYPDAETREAALATGMTDGMEMSYARLEQEVLEGAVA
ncbi:MAG: ATPase [Gemmatimonadales bacterium]|nr:MAG: ATPase [Gemmatimonadales bacterium]